MGVGIMGIFQTIYETVIDYATKAGTALDNFEALCMVAGVGLALVLFLLFWIGSTGGYVGKLNKALKILNGKRSISPNIPSGLGAAPRE